MAPARRIDLLGCPVDALRRQEFEQELIQRLRQHRPTTVLFANVAKVVWARRDASLRRALQAADFVLADGLPLMWVSHWLGTPLPERLPGVDMMAATLSLAARNSWRVFFLGTRPETLLRAVSNIRERFPGLAVAGIHDGYFPAGELPRVLAAINASRADLLLVALGSPQKELWLLEHARELQVPLRQAVGGSFEIFAGDRQRAPRWLQRLGLEWLYRLWQDPRNLAGRYLYTNTVFAVLVARALLGRLWRGKPV